MHILSSFEVIISQAVDRTSLSNACIQLTSQAGEITFLQPIDKSFGLHILRQQLLDLHLWQYIFQLQIQGDLGKEIGITSLNRNTLGSRESINCVTMSVLLKNPLKSSAYCT
jgi:hypothetical protein